MMSVNIRPLQVVYDANYLSLLVEDKEKCLDTIEYLQKQQGGSQSSQCPTTRVTSSTILPVEIFDFLGILLVIK